MDKFLEIDVPVLVQKLRQGEVLLVDVREADEFAACHIANALSIPLSELEKHLDSLSADPRAIVFQCQKGARGALAAEKFQAKSSDERTIYNLTGGIEAWQQGAQPVVAKSTAKARLPLNRQVFIAVGSLVFIFSALVLAGYKFAAVVTLLISCGLLIAGFTGWCGMAMLLKKMPWNK